MRKDIERTRELEKLFRHAKVSGEATEALEHASFDACDLLKQPPARRQVAVAHADFFNDAVSVDVNFQKLKEGHSREKKTMTVLNIVDATSAMHTTSQIPIQTSHTLWWTFADGWLR